MVSVDDRVVVIASKERERFAMSQGAGSGGGGGGDSLWTQSDGTLQPITVPTDFFVSADHNLTLESLGADDIGSIAITTTAGGITISANGTGGTGPQDAEVQADGQVVLSGTTGIDISGASFLADIALSAEIDAADITLAALQVDLTTTSGGDTGSLHLEPQHFLSIVTNGSADAVVNASAEDAAVPYALIGIDDSSGQIAHVVVSTSVTGAPIVALETSGGASGVLHFGGFTAVPADSEVGIGEFVISFDASSGAAKLKVKGRDAGGTIRTGFLALT